MNKLIRISLWHFYKKWKYAMFLRLALSMLVSAITVNALIIPIRHLYMNNGLLSRRIPTEYVAHKKENLLMATDYCVNTINFNELPTSGKRNIPGTLTFLNDSLRSRPFGLNKTRSECSNNNQAVFANLPLQDFMQVVKSLNFNSGFKAVPLLINFHLRHPWWIFCCIQFLILILLSAAGIFIVRKAISGVRYMEREKAETAKKIADLEIMALQTQMNPHFIFNSINSIQYFVLSNRTDDVLSYLSDFSKVVRGALANVSRKKVTLNEEIDFLKSYLRIEQMRFPDKFHFTVEVRKAIDSFGIMIPPYLILPFTENAVKHGFMHKKGTGHLLIVFDESDCETLKCTITDDGIGRAKALEIESSNTEQAKPPGSVITETRIRLFNSPEKPDRYKVIYTDLIDSEANSAGLKVEIYLPAENK